MLLGAHYPTFFYCRSLLTDAIRDPQVRGFIEWKQRLILVSIIRHHGLLRFHLALDAVFPPLGSTSGG